MLLNPKMRTGIPYSRGLQSYLQRAVVAAGFHFSQIGATTNNDLKTQDQVIKQMVSGVAPAQNETLQPHWTCLPYSWKLHIFVWVQESQRKLSYY